ncbi:MAG TPA: hypothetical protein VKM94_17945 [Blastocatellia bacterium]|nr:hypothetical protein [Blastocatellia bacterium]
MEQPHIVFFFPPTIFVWTGLALAITLAITIIVPKWRHRASIQSNLLLLICLLLLLYAILDTPIGHRWTLVVGLLPSILVAYQAFFLWLYQPKETRTRKSDTPETWEDNLLEKYRLRALNSVSGHFGVSTLSIRYLFPAVLLGIAGVIILHVLATPADFFSSVTFLSGKEIKDLSTEPTIEKIFTGLKLGAIGAYTYVLLELGQRTFRHDITGASAMWCLVNLILGPILAAAVSVLLRMSEPTNSEWWAGGVVLFFTGFAPRRVITALTTFAVQLLKLGGPGVVVQSRLVPLSKIRGISAQVEERLGEEGIGDVSSLAQAEPVRLLRNTSFDLRQILAWIDEAILMNTLPKTWEVLEEQGITGAIDLATFRKKFNFDEKGAIMPQSMPGTLKELAGKGNILPESLAYTIERLSEDAQVLYVWALYQNFTEFGGAGSERKNPSGSGDKPGPTDGSEANWWSRLWAQRG